MCVVCLSYMFLKIKVLSKAIIRSHASVMLSSSKISIDETVPKRLLVKRHNFTQKQIYQLEFQSRISVHIHLYRMNMRWKNSPAANSQREPIQILLFNSKSLPCYHNIMDMHVITVSRLEIPPDETAFADSHFHQLKFYTFLSSDENALALSDGWSPMFIININPI